MSDSGKLSLDPPTKRFVTTSRERTQGKLDPAKILDDALQTCEMEIGRLRFRAKEKSGLTLDETKQLKEYVLTLTHVMRELKDLEKQPNEFQGKDDKEILEEMRRLAEAGEGLMEGDE